MYGMFITTLMFYWFCLTIEMPLNPCFKFLMIPNLYLGLSLTGSGKVT
jgi:hypothetical protein